MNKFFTTLLTVVTLALALPAGLAGHCAGYTTADVELDTHTLGMPYYVDNDLCQIECLYSVWVYEETNGIDGLQRGDEFRDDTCHGMIEADTIIF